MNSLPWYPQSAQVRSTRINSNAIEIPTTTLSKRVGNGTKRLPTRSTTIAAAKMIQEAELALCVFDERHFGQ